LELVSALLSLARAGSAPLATRSVRLAAVVEDALAALRTGEWHGAQVPVLVGALPEVTVDPCLVRQIYVNLIGNAMKFCREASRPRVEVGAFQQEGREVLFVSDNGIGFDPARAPGLFEPFQRVHGARFGGHGLGLSIVRRIVERHGGRVWVRTRPGDGATFLFTLASDSGGAKALQRIGDEGEQVKHTAYPGFGMDPGQCIP
jgi:signal transduction histidine kinase